MEPRIIKGSEMQLRDVVRNQSPIGTGWDTATVVKIDVPNKMVHLFRPFVKCEDFSYTGGVLHTIGFEQYVVWFDTEFLLLDRPNDAHPIR